MLRGQTNDLIVRIEPIDFDVLVGQAGVRPFDFTGRAMPGMVYVDSGVLAIDVLRSWVQRGVNYVAAHPATPKRRTRA